MSRNPVENYLNIFIGYLHDPFWLACASGMVVWIAWMCYIHRGLWDWVLGIVLIALVAFAILYSSAESDIKKEEWKKWANEHCNVIAKKDGYSSIETGIGVTTNGQAATGVFTNSTSDQTAYKCDDGITYWKND
ncbi:hypothetical protein I2J55_003946 [Salmonella enterica]|nr:hypothetical protein [Salmonella enterica]